MVQKVQSENHSRQSRSDARRQCLLDTSRRLFAEQGFHQTGMSQIAKESGVAVGQIYRDFPNKEAIIVAICESSLEDWLQERTLDRAIETGDRTAIRGWLARLVTGENTFEERRMLVEILAESGRSPAIARLNCEIIGRFRDLLERALASFVPRVSPTNRALIVDLVLVLNWGLAAGQELDPGIDHAGFRSYAALLIQREIGSMLGEA